MKTLIVMCGIPGSGKSTWIKNHINSFKGSVKVVSRDTIRFNLVAEDEEYFSKEKEVFSTFISEIKDGLNNNDYTIADATHLNEKSRAKLLHALGKSINSIQIVCLVIKNDLKNAIDQNENRINTREYVPISAIRRMNSQYVQPTLEEGFSKIYIYNPNEEPKYKIIVAEGA